MSDMGSVMVRCRCCLGTDQYQGGGPTSQIVRVRYLGMDHYPGGHIHYLMTALALRHNHQILHHMTLDEFEKRVSCMFYKLIYQVYLVGVKSYFAGGSESEVRRRQAQDSYMVPIRSDPL